MTLRVLTNTKQKTKKYFGIQIENYLPLAVTWASKYIDRGVDFNELYSACLEGLLSAARYNDPTRKESFATIAILRMQAEMSNAIRKQQCKEKYQRKYETCEYTIKTTIPNFENNIDFKKIKSWMQELPARERYILENLYLKENIMTSAAIAKKLKISGSMVTLIHQNAIKKLQQKVL